MLAVLITHPGDRYLAVPLCEHIRRLGGVKTHECLIVAPNGTPMQGIEDVLRGAFGTVHLHTYTASLRGWPCGANEAAEAAMMHVAHNPALRYHYLMLEPDCVPTTPEWLNRIDADYRRVGQGVMGERIATHEIAPPHRVVGQHVIGVAVYPKLFAAMCPLVRGLSAMSIGYQGQNAMAPPWDAYIGPYAIRMLTETRLIQHLRRQMNQTPNGPKFDCPSLENALSQVRGDAVLIHGSKDPAFLPSITKIPTTNYAGNAHQERHREDRQENHGNAPRQEIPVVAPQIRHADTGQAGNGHEPEKKLTKEEKLAERQRQRDYATNMRLRTELGFEAMPGTPEWDRSRCLHGMPWPKLRAYASRLGVRGFGKGNSKPDIINRAIAKEKEERKEPWTKNLPQPQPSTVVSDIPVEETPPIPPGSFPTSRLQTTVQWGLVDDKGRVVQEPQGNEGPTMEEKMRALMARRMAGV